jgi:hypothetical protein
MKNMIKITTALLSLTISQAATIQISLTTTGNGVLSNLRTSSNTQGALMWGIIVDTGGNGFAGNSALTPYNNGFTYLPSANGTGYTAGASNPIDTDGIPLTVVGGGVGTTDDVLFLSFTGMLGSAYTNDGTGVLNTDFRPGSIAGVNYTANGVTGGLNFAVVWFDIVAAGNLNTVSASGIKYGMLTNNDVTAPAGTDLRLPAAQADSVNYSSSFVGAESARLANFSLGVPVPETSTTLLGALGALALLRRRRN